MDPINRLIKIFMSFPGIGPKQARRFVYYILTKPQAYTDDVIRNLTELKAEITECKECCRFYQTKNKESFVCDICRDEGRDDGRLLVVSRDVDFENIEKSGAFSGKYFILGGSVPILDKEPEKKVRIRELVKYVNQNGKRIKEIILGLDANADGEYTGDYVKKMLADTVKEFNIKITEFGRGLSTGTELEYSDNDTIKSAFKNRS